MANQEPEPLNREELLRVENITLRRELLNQLDAALLRDIAQAHMLEVGEYGKTWVVHENQIHRLAVQEVIIRKRASEVSDEVSVKRAQGWPQ